MLFLNRYEIAKAADLYYEHPILGPATRTLLNLRIAADENSDGWAYWPKPVRAAAKLMTLIGTTRSYLDNPERTDVTMTEYKKALVPIKAFRTRSGIDFEIEEV
jgi:hypothetical protein